MIYTLLHHQRAAYEYSLVTNKDITERWKAHGFPITQKRVWIMMKTGWIYLYDKKRNPNTRRRELLFPVRWKDKSELWLSLLTTPYKTAHRPNTASQAPWQHQAGDWTRWDMGLFLTAPPGMCLSGVGWVEKEDHDNSSLSGSSSTLYLKCFQMQKSSLRRNILPGFCDGEDSWG